MVGEGMVIFGAPFDTLFRQLKCDSIG